MTKPTEPRPLSTDERALIEFLLSVEFPGRDELRDQLDQVEVVETCDCGCGTLQLNVIGTPFLSPAESPIPLQACNDIVDVLVFARGGVLSSLELVFKNDDSPRLVPKPNDLKLWTSSPHNLNPSTQPPDSD